jgi:GTP pyrophosphokinase
MHDEAELGVCAHWRYKESGSAKTRHKVGSYEEKMAWLRQVLEWQEEIGDLEGLVEQFQASAMEQRVYVFTPDGHVIDLPQGSTPVDFAYYIHTEVGHRCRGAKVNGRIVPLSYRLRTGEQVEILKATEARPSRDWLNPGLGYVTNSRVRAKVQAWFKKQNRENNINAGKVILQRELKRLALANIDLKAIAKQLNLKSNEEIYAALGAGDLKLSQLLNALQPLLEQDLAKQPSSFVQPAGKQAAKPEGGVHIEGVGNLLTHMAGCCKPVPGDAIIGYITLGRGVSIHRQDCLHVLKLAEDDKRRLITVDWQQQQAAHTYPVEIKVRAYDRRGLLRDITALLANEKINVLGINTLSDLRQTTASLSLTLEIAGLQDLGRILAKINQLPNVVQAQRATSGRRS